MALYKMYTYSNRQDQALALIDEVLTEAAAHAGFPADWRGLAPASTAWAQASGPERIYLYSLKVRGFVLLRLAQPEAAREVLLKLMEPDPRDQVGGSVVLDIAQGVLEYPLEAAA